MLLHTVPPQNGSGERIRLHKGNKFAVYAATGNSVCPVVPGILHRKHAKRTLMAAHGIETWLSASPKVVVTFPWQPGLKEIGS